MSREIKFRIWDSDQNRVLPVIVMRYENGKQWFGFQRSEAGEVAKSMEYCEAYNGDPTVAVMQFTGLHDKSGREIYDGDIVRFPYELITEALLLIGVIDIKPEAIFIDLPKHGSSLHIGSVLDQWSENEIEIIGNEHENPELLE